MHYTVILMGTSKVNSSRRARCHSPSVRSAKWHACMLFSVNGRCTQHYFLFVHCYRCLKVTEAGSGVCLDWFSQRNWGKVSGVWLNTAEYHRSPQVWSLGSHYKNRTQVTADQVQESPQVIIFPTALSSKKYTKLVLWRWRVESCACLKITPVCTRLLVGPLLLLVTTGLQRRPPLACWNCYDGGYHCTQTVKTY